MAIGEAGIKIFADMAGFGPGLERNLRKQTAIAEAEGRRAGGGFGRGISTGAKLALGAGIAVVGAFAVSAVKAFKEAEKSETQLNFAFERFPKLADISREELTKLNEKIAQHTRFSVIDSRSAEASLAQFNLTGKQIKQLLPIVADYAARTGKTLPESATLVGRALLGNTRALKAVGISLKIATTGSKDLGKAQDALAKAQTRLTDLEQRLTSKRKLSLSESVALQRAEDALNKARAGGDPEKIQRAEQNLALARDRAARSTQLSVSDQQALQNAQQAVAIAQGKVNAATAAGTKGTGAYNQVLDALKGKIGGFAEKEGKTFEGRLAELRNKFDEIKVSAGHLIVNALGPVVSFIVDKGIPAIQGFGRRAGDFIGVFAKAVKDDVIGAFFKGFTTKDADKAADRLKGMADDGIRFKDVLESLKSVMDNDVGPAFETLGAEIGGKEGFGAVLFKAGGIMIDVQDIALGFIRDTIGGFEAFGRFIEGFVDRFQLSFQGVGDMLHGTLDIIRTFVTGSIAFAGGLMRFIAGVFTLNIKAAIHGLGGAFSGLARAWSGAIGGAIRIFIGFAETIAGTVLGLVGKFFGFGSNVARGFFDGIIHTVGKLASHLPGFLKKLIPDNIKKFFGIHSPSKLMFDIGAQVGAGFNLGVLQALQRASVSEMIAEQMRTGGITPLNGVRTATAPVAPITIITNQDPEVIAERVLFKQARAARR